MSEFQSKHTGTQIDDGIDNANAALQPGDVINTLVSTETAKPLSAAQGKALQDGKLSTADVVNNLTSVETTKPLAAAQGKALQDGKVGTTRTVSAGTGLQGGGDLSANRTLSLSAASQASLLLADSSLQPGDAATELSYNNGSSALVATNVQAAVDELAVVVTRRGDIGVAGEAGFGVGIYPHDLPAGFSGMTGTLDRLSPNYGNYQYSDGSVAVFVPAFYYRIGNSGSPNFATYGANAVDIATIYDFETEALANADGYVLHRAFIDGGAVKSGFFLDKYVNSKDTDTGLTHGSSLKDGVPISLTTTSTYTRSQGMTGCVGQLYDAITLSKARGTGWQCASAFQYAAVALLSLAHGQAASSATHCAWYNAAGTTNFPKGCNNNALGDTNDGTISFTTAGDAGMASKPLAGSGVPFAKTTHNGQDNGIADLNGTMWEMAIGVTTWGTSSTDSTQRGELDADVGKFWILKESVEIATLTSGWDGATDHWQSEANIGTMYDEVVDGMWWAYNAAAYIDYGNGTEQVFSGDASGDGYLRTSIGHPLDTGVSAAGTNLFGQDGLYQYQRRNLALLSGGTWTDSSQAGVWARFWNRPRTLASYVVGFRASAYGQ